MEFIVKRLPLPARQALRSVCHLLVIAFLGVVAYQGLFVMMPQQLDQVSPSLGITMAIPYAAIPVSALMLIAVECALLWQEWHGRSIKSAATPLEL
jgi:TRAP-type C4-dicarboxylate transport system permease small subunit